AATRVSPGWVSRGTPMCIVVVLLRDPTQPARARRCKLVFCPATTLAAGFSDPMNKCRRPLKACGGLAFCKRQKNQTTVLMLNTSLADGQNVTGMGSFGL
ncbi:hypothetical protein, partial [Stutzerimonas balearica]|uniref:hypothetical protein n=1 Tax=Stutzerimonas balearica TaxID=74829 RepID=UPI0028ABB307